jgi:hypothetical protein
MLTFHIQDQTGHSTIEFKPEQRAGAEAKFNELVNEKKMAPFVKPADSKNPPLRVKSFDQVPLDAEVTMRPQLGGG